jgi:stress response protein YsnF
MITREQISQVVGHPVHDSEGKKIGDAKHMYLDDATGDPEWVTVKTGFFGNNETFVPTRSARLVEDHLEIPYDKDKVKGAPNVDVDSGGHLSVEEERHLYAYYGLENAGGGRAGQGTGQKAAAGGAAAGTAGAAGAAGGGGRHARGGRDADAMSGSEAGIGAGAGPAAYATGRTGPAERLSADAAAGDSGKTLGEEMIRSEEEMSVHVERREAGRARLHKVVDVEDVEQTVPVTHEEIRLEREPITDATRSGIGESSITEDEQVVTLHEEQPVVDTRIVPKERVRMRVEEHTEQRTVHGRVRKERIESDTAAVESERKGTRETGQDRRDQRFR